MIRRIPSLLLIAVAVTTLAACEESSVNPKLHGATISGLEAPAQETAPGWLFAKWLTMPPRGGVNGLKGSGE